MEWIERLNTTIEYIENHLTEKIDYEQLAKIAGCPSYHFQKTFLYMTNISLSEYIRKRRISLAAVDLQTGEDKIIDIALKYGYESPTAFNRAFQAVHGIAPSLVRKKNVQIKSFPALKFTFSIQGLDELSFRIEKKDSFKILGISSLLSKELLENFVQIPKTGVISLLLVQLIIIKILKNIISAALPGPSFLVTEQIELFKSFSVVLLQSGCLLPDMNMLISQI